MSDKIYRTSVEIRKNRSINTKPKGSKKAFVDTLSNGFTRRTSVKIILKKAIVRKSKLSNKHIPDPEVWHFSGKIIGTATYD